MNPAEENVAERIAEITDGRGVDTAIEAVGLPAPWQTCADNVKEGGNIAVVGVHGKPVEFPLQQMWIKNLKITTGLVNANTTGMLLKAVQKHRPAHQVTVGARFAMLVSPPRADGSMWWVSQWSQRRRSPRPFQGGTLLTSERGRTEVNVV